MPHERILQLGQQVVRARQACWDVFSEGQGNVKLGSSPVWNLARAERSRLCICAFVERRLEDQGVKNWSYPVTNIRDRSTCVSSVSSVT